MTRGHGYRLGLAGFALFSVASGDLWRNLIGYGGWIAVSGAGLVLVAIELVRLRHRFRYLPASLLAYLVLITASIAWSHYRGWTALGVLAAFAGAAAGVYVGLALTRAELLRMLGAALKWSLGLSLLFELVVAVVVRHPVLPVVPPPGVDESGKVPAAFYWSRALLLEGGRIQGINGNANLLGMLALVGVIVFGLQLASGSVSSRVRAGAWLVLAVAMVALTRSATVLAAAIAVGIALALLLLVRRADAARRRMLYLAVVVVGGVAAVGVVVNQAAVIRLLGRDDDTHRSDIWAAVARIAQEHPVLGWGFVGYWPPATAPFDAPAFTIRGVTYLQAHDTWLDVWLQLGVIGLAVFGFFVLVTLARAWWQAADRPRVSRDRFGDYDTVTLLAPLVLVALLVQSVAESRLLTEFGFVLLTAFAVRARLGSPGLPVPTPVPVATASDRPRSTVSS